MQQRREPGFPGSGPGGSTPGGCSVDLCRRLPPGDEPQIIAAAVPLPARLREPGSGTGPLTRPRTLHSLSPGVDDFERVPREAGLFVRRYPTTDGTWVAASPIT